MSNKQAKGTGKSKSSKPPAWQTYQFRVRDLFHSMGLEAEADVEIQGVRGKHGVDVRVAFQRYGIHTTWIVECKLWNTNIPKEKVLALQSIVQDVGADKGLLFSEKGFQAGAIACAHRSNILLTSIAEVTTQAQDEIRTLKVRRLDDDLLHVHSEMRNLTWRQEVRKNRDTMSILSSAPPDYIMVLGQLTAFEHCLKQLKIGDTSCLIIGFNGDEPVYVTDPDPFLDALERSLISARAYVEQYRNWRPTT